jgi:serine phosphatase RsbU (regulator of sigma subunit)
LNSHEEEFGGERLKDLLKQLLPLSAQEIAARLSDELRNWMQGADQHDDLTFLVMKVNSQPVQ